MPLLNVSTGTLHYADVGRGPAIVLVHGFPIDGRIWDDVVSLLAEGNRVIVPDLPGFGRSFATRPFTMASLASSMVELLDQLEIESAAFAGLSMGGYVLQSLMRARAERASQLIFVDTRASADDAAGRAARDAMIALVKEKGTEAIAEQMLPKMLAPATFATQPGIVARQREIMMTCRGETIANACAAMRDREDFTAELSSLPCPLQIIVGEHDAIAPPAVARSMHEAVKRSRLDVIEAAGHMSPIEQPAAVARAIENFLVPSPPGRGLG